MGVLNFKLKTIYGNKKSNGSNEFFAPKKYEKFIEKCEQLYSINYSKDIHHALFYKKKKKEYLVSNNNVRAEWFQFPGHKVIYTVVERNQVCI